MKDASVLGQIAELERLPFPALKDRWRELMGTEPPGYGRRLLFRRLAHRLQELAFGGLKEEHYRMMDEILREEGLDELASIPGRGKTPKRKPGQAVTGTRLIREWRGQRHEVTVVQGGYEFQGRLYKSLSAIAKVITGTHWNGPAFFGLRPAPRKEGSP